DSNPLLRSARSHLSEESAHSRIQFRRNRSTILNSLPGMVQRVLKAGVAVGFTKVVDGMGLERALHVLGMRGGEDHLRYPIVTEHLEDAYAIELGHLNVEEDEIGGHLFDGSNRLDPVLALADHFDVLVVRE